jgi:hypothetical protein
MTDERSAVDAVLDRLVYAPIGLVSDARTVLPQLAERGRMQAANAKMMGRFAIQMGSAEASKRMGGLEGQLRSMLVGFGFLPPEVAVEQSRADDGEAGGGEEPSTPRQAAGPDDATKRAAPAGTRDEPEERARPEPATVPLAIPEYDTLAASQVVSRLAGLRPAELEAVKQHELAHRGRKTILGKIAQLQAG